jgi:hypothetical protein
MQLVLPYYIVHMQCIYCTNIHIASNILMYLGMVYAEKNFGLWTFQKTSEVS